MGSIVLTTLSVFLGLIFIFVSSLKLTSSINRDMHREIRRNFVQYSKVFPLSASLGFKVSPKIYRLTVGWTELTLGLFMVLIPGVIKQIANIALLLLTLLALYTHLMINDKFERIAPSIVFTLMLTCRLVVFWQVKQKGISVKTKEE